MSGELHELATTFLRGTARAALPAPGTLGMNALGMNALGMNALGAALAKVQRPTPEETLLARAALSGLYTQAGRVPATVQTPAPVYLQGEPERRPPVPAALVALFPSLVDHPALLHQMLGLLVSAGYTLPAPGALPLLPLTDGGTDGLSGPLWTLLDDHGRWLARLNPDWNRHDPATPPDAVRLTRLRREVVEAHASDAEACAQDLLSRWPTFRAEARRTVMNAVAASLHPADGPLLELATQDRLQDVRRRALLLRGHLPGEVQEAVRAALPTWFRREKGKLKLVTGQSAAALGEVDPQNHGDSELGRLLGAYPTAGLSALLGLNLNELLEALKKYPEHTGGQANQSRGVRVLEDLERASAAGLTLEDLEALRLSATPDSLIYWSRSRLESLLWDATGKLLRAPQENHALAYLVQSLMSALPSLPDGAQELSQPSAPPKGLLARLASALKPAPDTARDWPRRWEEVALWIDQELGREVQHYASPLPDLLTRVALALDLSRPDPVGARPQLSDGLPGPRSKKQEEQQAKALTLYNQQMRSQAGLARTLELRRRVRTALAGEA